MNQRVRHKHSASVFVVLLRGAEICMLRRKGTGWMDGSLSVPAGGLDANETILNHVSDRLSILGDQRPALCGLDQGQQRSGRKRLD